MNRLFGCVLSLGLSLSLAACKEARVASDGGVDGGTYDPSVVIDTEGGLVEGRVDPDERVYHFPNIPYAAPPVGPNRFRAPQPPAVWGTTTRDYASSAAAQRICPQKLPLGANGLAVGTEDCLYLNVVVPVARPTNAPVIVWIHGGGFSINSGEQYDRATNGITLAERTQAIVVTINYRLAQFGFLAHPALTAEAGRSGNYGLLDQLAALRWVKRNIAAFGGDPASITLYGQSAGGQSLCAIMATPLLTDDAVVPAAERPLFHAAILQSAACDANYRTLAAAETVGESFATMVGCDTGTESDAQIVACLRDATATTMPEIRDTMPYPADFLRASGNEQTWGPNVDGYFMPAHPLDRIEGDLAHEVPVFAGFTEDEGNTAIHFRVQRSTLDPDRLRITDQGDLDTIVDGLFVGGIQPGEQTMLDSIAAYDPASYTDIAIPASVGTFTPQVVTAYEQAFAAIHGDVNLACSSRRTIRALESAQIPVFAYFYRYDDAPFQLATTFPLGAFHNADTQLFFGTPAGGALLGKTFTATEQAMSDTMRDYVGNFVRTHDPNGAGLVTWPAYDSGTTSTHLAFAATFAPIDDPLAARCAVWDSIGRSRLTPP